MEDWVRRALLKWPNVPALFGWLSLDRRGRWLIHGELITRPQIVETINHNYAADEHGRWFFQNGPQRGYMTLEYAPWVLRSVDEGSSLETHTGQEVKRIDGAFLDEHGSLLLQTEHGPGLLADTELEWALSRLRSGGQAVDEEALADALALPDRASTSLTLSLGDSAVPVVRLDFASAPSFFGFVREPQPREGERASTGEVAQD